MYVQQAQNLILVFLTISCCILLYWIHVGFILLVWITSFKHFNKVVSF